jgi:hypothetical protein
MDGLSDILKAVADANTPLKVLVILAIVIAAIVWQVSKRATLSETTTQTLVLGGYGLVALLIVAAVGTLFLHPHPPETTIAGTRTGTNLGGKKIDGTEKPPAAVTFVGRVYSGGDQRQGVTGAVVHLVPLLPTGPQRDLKTDADGAVTSSFTLDRPLSGFMWASDDGFNPTNQLVFLLDPANSSPPVQFFDLGAPKTVVAANTQPPAAAAAPPAAPATAPPPQGGSAASPPSSSLPAAAFPSHAVLAAAEHAVVPHPGFHVSLAATHLMANNLFAPMPHASVVAAAPATAPAAQALLMQTNYGAKFASIQTDEAQLCNVAAEAFSAGQYATAIKFILQAQKISKSGLWKLSYPKLAAAYFLTGQTQQGNTVLAQMRTDSQSGILAGSAARLYIGREIGAMPPSLGDANRTAIRAAAGNP